MNIPERVDGMGNLTDGELVARVRQGNQEAFSELISRYYGLLQWKISGYRKLGIDADDLLQEAALGLLDSVMSFQEGKGASFETYATVCVNNRLVTLYRAAARQKISLFILWPAFRRKRFQKRMLGSMTRRR